MATAAALTEQTLSLGIIADFRRAAAVLRDGFFVGGNGRIGVSVVFDLNWNAHSRERSRAARAGTEVGMWWEVVIAKGNYVMAVACWVCGQMGWSRVPEAVGMFFQVFG